MSAPAASEEDNPLASYRWRSRLLVVFADSPSDAHPERQRNLMVEMGGEALERDLVLIEAVGRHAKAEALRRQLGMHEGSFTAVLVGKDGGAKIISKEPLTPKRLIATIDAMPMRKQEMRR
jgi:hypothetical protein